MSTTGNDYEEPGVNYPDRENAAGAADTPEPARVAETETDAVVSEEPVTPGVDARDDGSDHHGRDEGRNTLTVGETQRAQGPGGEQRLPAMSQNNATDDEKIEGVVAQTRQDVGHLGEQRAAEVLRQRFEQTGVTVSDDDIARLAARVVGAD